MEPADFRNNYYPSNPNDYNQYSNSENGMNQDEMFYSNPYQEEYSNQVPQLVIVGYQNIQIIDRGLSIFKQVPIYDYVYPISEEQIWNESNDLNLSNEEVGFAVDSSIQENRMFDTGEVVDEFFQSCSSPDTLDFPQILKNYMAKLEGGDKFNYLPRRYARYQNLRTSQNISFNEWRDAFLHNPPLEMLKSLDKIESICKNFQASPNQSVLPTFLFPCSLSIPEPLKQKLLNKYQNSNSVRNFIKNKSMVLELSVEFNGKPSHVFLRPLCRGEDYLEKNLGESKDKVFQIIKNSEFPILTKENPQFDKEKSKDRSFTHLKFHCQEGIVIKAPLKNSRVDD